MFRITEEDLKKMAAELEAEFFPPPPVADSEQPAVSREEMGRRVADCCKQLESGEQQAADG